MFSFFKKKPPAPAPAPESASPSRADTAAPAAPPTTPEDRLASTPRTPDVRATPDASGTPRGTALPDEPPAAAPSWLARLGGWRTPSAPPAPIPEPPPSRREGSPVASPTPVPPHPTTPKAPPAAPGTGVEPVAPGAGVKPVGPSFGANPVAPGAGVELVAPGAAVKPVVPGAGVEPAAAHRSVAPPNPAANALAPEPMEDLARTEASAADAVAVESARRDWISRLRGGLRKTGSSLTQVFVGARVDEALYDELEAALLQADAGVQATTFLLGDLKKRVKRAGVADPMRVKALLGDALADLLKPLQRSLRVGEHTPTVIMVVGVNGAGKTTTIGKLTRHLVDAGQKVLLAAADTFRAAAREQLAVWAQRADQPGTAVGVDIVSQEGGDPAGVTFDAVIAGKARGCDVVIADTAGRLTTQLHLMEELKKIRRVIAKAQGGAPHEVLLVIDGNTGQNALAQVKAFDAALQLTGLVITKLDGTAKGGVLAAIALWAQTRADPISVYFVGVGEKLEDLQTFDAREFAQALLG